MPVSSVSAGFVAPGFELLAALFGGSLGRGGGALALRQGERALVDVCAGWPTEGSNGTTSHTRST